MSRIDRFERVEFQPDPQKQDLDPLTLYVLYEERNVIEYLCPCGCGNVVRLPLRPWRTRPSWELTIHDDGTLTLSPSVWAQEGCLSHYNIDRNAVKWC